ncbi:14402_t:CDS:2, partial [Dentiscutata heterogama]
YVSSYLSDKFDTSTNEVMETFNIYLIKFSNSSLIETTNNKDIELDNSEANEAINLRVLVLDDKQDLKIRICCEI